MVPVTVDGGKMARFRTILCALLAIGLVASVGTAADLTASLKLGKADLKSAGALAFAGDGVMLVGDSIGAAVFAIDTQDRTASTAKPVDVKGVDAKIAAMLGTTPDQIMINDLAVNPISHKVYLSVSRGRGPAAVPVILRMDTGGKIQEFTLDSVKHAKAMLPNAAESKEGGRSNPRMEAITDLAFVDNQVVVAGLSNEEFSSNLRSIPFPFQTVSGGTSIEIWHASHGRFETNSPVRTFVPYTVKQEQLILAAYTCTPLVKFPVKQLKPGSKVQGTTIAELGAGNRPIDMIVYTKGGKDFVLMSNNSRGVMKMSMEGLEAHQAITKPEPGTAGVPYTTLDLKGVDQLDKVDNNTAVVLQKTEGGSIDIQSIVLP
jgi:hypothetical protein